MIEYKTGDVLREDAEAIINTVNCVGVMGRGIALQVKKAFPENFKAYAAACKRNEMKPGRVFVFETNQSSNPRYIINFPTKRHWREKSCIEDIECGLLALTQVISEKNIRSIAIPPLGCGLGGLDWSQVRPRIEQALADLKDLQIIIFEPRGVPDNHKMARSGKIPKMTPGRAALVELMHHYLAGLLDPFVTLLEVHKLMYFMQIAGQPLRLNFKKGPYGPYAENLRHVLNTIEGHFISGYADGGDEPNKQLTLLPGAIEDATAFLKHNMETRIRFDKVNDLVKGFESAFGLELLATVHWVTVHERVQSVEDTITKIHAWNKRKKQFTPRQIKLATDVLVQKAWIDKLN